MGGKSYQLIGKPRKVPSRWQTKGKIEIIAGYDFKKKKVITQFSKSKRVQDFKRFIRNLFNRYKNYQKVFLVTDNFRMHKAKSLIQWLRIRNKLNQKQDKTIIQILYLPTYSPWLNQIEPILGVMVKMVIQNSDYQSEKELIQTIRSFFKQFNKRKRNIP